MSPYHGYPFGKVKLERGLCQAVRPWRIIEALLEHATHAGRLVTTREATDVLGLLCQSGDHSSRLPVGDGQELVVTTTLDPRVTTVTLHPSTRKGG